MDTMASSDPALSVTYFPLLLFLEVLMSMQNSAERLSEKREGVGRRERRGGMEKSGEQMSIGWR